MEMLMFRPSCCTFVRLNWTGYMSSLVYSVKCIQCCGSVIIYVQVLSNYDEWSIIHFFLLLILQGMPVNKPRLRHLLSVLYLLLLICQIVTLYQWYFYWINDWLIDSWKTHSDRLHRSYTCIDLSAIYLHDEDTFSSIFWFV